MSTSENKQGMAAVGNGVASVGASSDAKQEQLGELVAQMQGMLDADTMSALADRLKALAQQPADELHSFDESELPDWAVHEEDQAEISAFFNLPAERGRSEGAFSIPRGSAEDAPTSAAPVAQAGQLSAVEIEYASLVTDPGAGSDASVADSLAGSPSLAAGPEVEQDPSEGRAPAEQAADDAPADRAADDAPAEQAAGDALDEPAVGDAPAEHEQAVGDVPAAATEGGEQAAVLPGLQFDKSDKSEHDLPRREDFARFRCIYESRDGQLALYEDADGHLTAVNTNHFA